MLVQGRCQLSPVSGDVLGGEPEAPIGTASPAVEKDALSADYAPYR